MRCLIFLLTMVPPLLYSQTPDLRFWEDKQPLPGCKTWNIKSRAVDPVTPFSMNIVDCYGESRNVGGMQADGSMYSLCSMVEPTGGGLLVQYVAETIYD